MSGSDAIRIVITFHLLDIKIMKMFSVAGIDQIPAALSGNGDVWGLQRDLLRRFSYIRTPAFQSFFNDR